MLVRQSPGNAAHKYITAKKSREYFREIFLLLLTLNYLSDSYFEG